MNTNSWRTIIDKINKSLDLHTPINVLAISDITKLDACTIRGFLPLSNAKELIVKSGVVYVLDSQPKKIATAKLIRLLLAVSKKLDNVEYLSARDIYNKLHTFNHQLSYENVTAQVYQLNIKGELGRKGYAGAYTYCLNPVRSKVAAPRINNMADQLILIAEFVEKTEARQLELETENIRLTKELNNIKSKLKNMLGE